MTPEEFWNCTYREANVFIQANLIKTVDDLKREINLQEAVTNKLIRADSMSKRPKIIPIRDSFKELFPEEEKNNISSTEITRKMRNIMKSDNK